MKKILIILIITVAAICACVFSCCTLKENFSDDRIQNPNDVSMGDLINSTSREGIEINEINFPDDVFREWLTDSRNVNGYGSDGLFTDEELADIKNITITGTSDKLIKDLKGIEYFSELTTLSVPYNSLISLDLSYNTKITYLNCSYNKLEDLNIKNLNSLRSLFCEFNYLKNLDLSGNVSLTVLYCRHNILENLDLSNNTKLVFIETFDNKLTQIDVSMLSELEFLHIDHNRLTVLDMSGNLNLKGGGFVVRNNYMQKLILPSIEGFTVYYDDFAEQDPIKGYENSLWYEDENFTVPVNSDVLAEGQTLYVKRIPNSYTVNFIADGASGIPSSVKTFYDQYFYIPEEEPIKKGYRFLWWSDDKYTDENTYTAGQLVSNLAGDRYDGEKTTLYAKWQGISYKISFDKNADDATGTMSYLNAVYGTHCLLPLNEYKRQGFDFEGWSLSKGGEVSFSDNESVLNLAFSEGEVITLYAVWSENSYSLQQPYIQKLRSEFEILSLQNYYEEDLSLLNSLYNGALEEINNSYKDAESMKTATEIAISEMNRVATVEERAADIAKIWKSNNASLIERLDVYPIPAGEAESCLEEVSAALSTADIATFSSYSTLKNPTDRENAAQNALYSIKEYTDECLILKNAAEWITEIEFLTGIPLSSILPKNTETCAILTERYYSFTMNETKFIDDAYSDSLKLVYEIAYSKTAGIKKLNRLYESKDLSLCSEEDIELIKEIIENTKTDVLTSESPSYIYSVISDANIKIQEILEKKDNIIPDEDEKNPVPEDPSQDDAGSDDADQSDTEPESPSKEQDINDKDAQTVKAVAISLSVLALSSVIFTAVFIYIKRRKTK